MNAAVMERDGKRGTGSVTESDAAISSATGDIHKCFSPCPVSGVCHEPDNEWPDLARSAPIIEPD